MLAKKTVFIILIACAVLVSVIATAGRVTHAQGSADASIMAKLNEVIGNQQAILADLAGIKEELRIIKIRVTQAQ